MTSMRAMSRHVRLAHPSRNHDPPPSQPPTPSPPPGRSSASWCRAPPVALRRAVFPHRSGRLWRYRALRALTFFFFLSHFDDTVLTGVAIRGQNGLLISPRIAVSPLMKALLPTPHPVPAPRPFKRVMVSRSGIVA
jgi:hypothetical protein